MTTGIIANLEKLLGTAKDNAVLRFSLGNEYLKMGNPDVAINHFREAVNKDPMYSAAWKLLGKTLIETNSLTEALEVYHRGIAVAEKKGDQQALKEMTVFAKRIEKKLSGK